MASVSQTRSAYYLSRRQTGKYLNRPLAFYSGASSIPLSYTANTFLVGPDGNGPGAKILNGIGPVPPVACDPPVISSLVSAIGVHLTVTVLYSSIEPGDAYIMFNTADGTHLPVVSVVPVLGGVVIDFDDDSPPATSGSYTFKIVRAGNPSCLAIQPKIFTIAPPPCPISITTMVGSGVIPPGPPVAWGDLGLLITLTGFGFTAGPLTVTITNTGPPFNLLDITGVVVIDDNNMTVAFDANTGGFPASPGLFEVKVALTATPTCFDTISAIGVIAA